MRARLAPGVCCALRKLALYRNRRYVEDSVYPGRFGIGIAGLFCFALVLTAAAENPAARSWALDRSTIDRVNRAVRHVLAIEGAPSASIAIVLNGKLAYAAAYGDANLAPRIPATTRTRYQLASISKSLTAQAVLLLEGDGKLSLDDKLSRWLPSLKSADQVTVREVLQHTAGYPDHYPQTYPAGPRALPITADAIIGEWGQHPTLFRAGSRFRYSNFDYVVAGRIVEITAGEDLYSFLKQRVFDPVGMSSTIDLDDVDENTPDLAIGYLRPALGKRVPAPTEGRGWSFGAGQIVTTASDLAQWDESFLAGRLLAERQRKEQVDVPILADGSRSEYALGLYVSENKGRARYSHTGQGLGYLAVNRIYPDERAAIVVLTNDSSSSAFSRIADRIEYLTIPPTAENEKARALFASLQSGHIDRGKFSKDLDHFFDERLRRVYQESLGPLGQPEYFIQRGEDTADGITTRTYEIALSDRRLRMVVQLLEDGRFESVEVAEIDR